VPAGRIVSIASALLFLTLALSGCNQATLIEKITPQDDKAAAESNIDLLRTNNLDALQKKLDPSIEDPHDDLAKMAVMFPLHQQPTSIKVVGYHITRTSEASTREISLEYEFPEKWLLASIITQTKGSASAITSFHVTELPDSLEYTNRFTFAHRGFEQYLMLVMIALDLTVTAYAFILCLKARMGARKWYWPIFIVLGFGTFSVNWNSGEVDFSILSFHLPPVGASGGFYSPWIVYAAVPVGAILFLLFRDDLTEHVPHIAVPPPPVLTP
jgi:hypothetical protein